MVDKQRLELFNFYQSFDSPILNITLNVDCLNFKQALKDNGISLYQYFIFNLCKTTMQHPNFQLRFNGKSVYRIERLVASYTVMRKSGLFNFCTFEFSGKFEDFIQTSLKAKLEAEDSDELCMDDQSHKDYIFMTCLPWFEFSSIQHPVGSFKDSSIPSFAFGKLTTHENKLSFPLSIQVHHGLVDGIHIQEFVELFIKNLESIIH